MSRRSEALDAEAWNHCDEPAKLLDALRQSGRATDRKLRLFAAACCRRLWPLLTDVRSQNAVEAAERYADGQSSERRFNEAADAAYEAADDAAFNEKLAGWELVHDATWRAAHSIDPDAFTFADAHFLHEPNRRPGEHPDELALLHCIFGNPWTSPTFDPAWLTWNNGHVVALAKAAYEERELPQGTLLPSRLAALADGLARAGCTNEEILGHLRSPGPHVRGCWPVDMALERCPGL